MALKINAKLYERIYKEISEYGEANANHCPGIRLFPHYKKYLKSKELIIDLGSGRGETVAFLRDLKYNAYGIDWINSSNRYCKRGDISYRRNLTKYSVALCFDVIEHLNNKQVKKVFENMAACKKQIFSIANSESIITLDEEEIDLHINKKSFDTWRGIILDYFDIIEEIPIRDYHRLYICEKKKPAEEYINHIVDYLRKHGYEIKKKENNE